MAGCEFHVSTTVTKWKDHRHPGDASRTPGGPNGLHFENHCSRYSNPVVSILRRTKTNKQTNPKVHFMDVSKPGLKSV